MDLHILYYSNHRVQEDGEFIAYKMTRTLVQYPESYVTLNVKKNFENAFGDLKENIGKYVVSAIGGILPIEGRVTVSAGVLDTMCSNHSHNHGREKMGIVDYLGNHHYYLWSPLEKTVILPIAAFGLKLYAIKLAIFIFY